MSFRIIVSSLAAERLSAARDVLRARSPNLPTLIVGASRGAADDLAREVAVSVPATFGLQRVSLTQLAARSAMVALAMDGHTPSTWLGAEAVAARAAFDATRQRSLKYFAPVASTPGFPRALSRTLQELRLAGVDAKHLLRAARGGSDLADLLERVEESFDRASSVDRAALFAIATSVIARAHPAPLVVLIDVAIDRRAEEAFIAALVAGAETAVATMPASDRDGIARLESMGGIVEDRSGDGTGDLACLRRFLFSPDTLPAERKLDGSLEFFSAPGEGRESVEIARRILREARAGVRFDEMAILVRSPQSYVGLLEHALRRAEVPAWFDRGTRRPQTAGRAFLALLACASEQLSASRFAEYLSLGQVPLASEKKEANWAASQDEAFGRRQSPGRGAMTTASNPGARDPGSRVRLRRRAARCARRGDGRQLHRRCRRHRAGCDALEASARRQAAPSSSGRSRSQTRRRRRRGQVAGLRQVQAATRTTCSRSRCRSSRAGGVAGVGRRGASGSTRSSARAPRAASPGARAARARRSASDGRGRSRSIWTKRAASSPIGC